MTGVFTQYGAPVPLIGHRQYLGSPMARHGRKARDLAAQRARIQTNSYFITDNQAELIPQVVGARAVIFAASHPEEVRELYANCERAPFGWEARQ